MDHGGALLGTLLAWLLLEWSGISLRGLFGIAAVPALVAVLVLWLGVREPAREFADRTVADGKRPVLGAIESPALRRYLVVVAVFTLGYSTDLFLVARASSVGVPDSQLPLLWAVLHMTRSLFAVPLGTWSDRIGRRPLLMLGLCIYAAVYLGFGAAQEPWHVWALFVVYGLHSACTEGAERALVADLAPAARRGAAFGAFYVVTGLCALPASAVFGWLWKDFGPLAAFGTGAGLAVLAALLLTTVQVPSKAST
jgi:MFS family permease